MSSVLIMILFSLERYKLVSNTKNKFIEILSKCKLYKIILATIGISFLFSIEKIFEYRTKHYYLSQLEYPQLNIFHLIDEKKWFILFIYCFHYILNDFILLLINLIIDIRLVILIRKDLNSKKGFALKNFNQNNHQLNEILKNKLNKTLDEIHLAEINTNKMIIYSFILYLFCRLPELCLYFYLILCGTNINFIIHSFGPVAINLVEYIYVLSYSFNLFFYFKFNKNFRDAFKNLLNIHHQKKQISS